MAIVATGSKTIIDLSDGKSLSVYIGSNLPRTQIQNGDTNAFNPDWTSTNLKLTPVIYVNQEQKQLNDANITIAWQRKAGAGDAAALLSTETVSGGILTVKDNVLEDIASGLITYLATVTYKDPDTLLPISAVAEVSFALVSTGASAETAWVTGEQVFKYDENGNNPSPASITLTAHLQNATMVKWQYKNGSGAWVDYATGNGNTAANATEWIVLPGSAIWNNDVATVRMVAQGMYGEKKQLTDDISLYKVFDGKTGASGTSSSLVYLTNENITFAGNLNGQVPATTKTSKVVAFVGNTKTAPTVDKDKITGVPAGMTVTVANAADASNELAITIAVNSNATLGGAGEQQGTISIPVLTPVATTLTINWSKVNTGKTGAEGDDGENAIVMNLYAPQGTVFVNQEGEKTIAVSAYDGSSPITSSASYTWAEFEGGEWVVVDGATGASIEISGIAVDGSSTFRCVMEYPSGSGKEYADVITLIDKTDNYQATIDSTGGDIFKNTVGTSELTCVLWQNGKKVDEDGTMFDYKWYRLNKDGKRIDNTGKEIADNAAAVVFDSGKTIIIDGADVDNKTTFYCEVSKKAVT